MRQLIAISGLISVLLFPSLPSHADDETICSEASSSLRRSIEFVAQLTGTAEDRQVILRWRGAGDELVSIQVRATALKRSSERHAGPSNRQTGRSRAPKTVTYMTRGSSLTLDVFDSYQAGGSKAGLLAGFSYEFILTPTNSLSRAAQTGFLSASALLDVPKTRTIQLTSPEILSPEQGEEFFSDLIQLSCRNKTTAEYYHIYVNGDLVNARIDGRQTEAQIRTTGLSGNLVLRVEAEYSNGVKTQSPLVQIRYIGDELLEGELELVGETRVSSENYAFQFRLHQARFATKIVFEQDGEQINTRELEGHGDENRNFYSAGQRFTLNEGRNRLKATAFYELPNGEVFTVSAHKDVYLERGEYEVLFSFDYKENEKFFLFGDNQDNSEQASRSEVFLFEKSEGDSELNIRERKNLLETEFTLHRTKSTIMIKPNHGSEQGISEVRELEVVFARKKDH